MDSIPARYNAFHKKSHFAGVQSPAKMVKGTEAVWNLPPGSEYKSIYIDCSHARGLYVNGFLLVEWRSRPPNLAGLA